MCNKHLHIWQNLALKPMLDDRDRDDMVQQIRRACQTGQTCDGGRVLPHADPTANTALANVSRTNRTL